MALCAGSLRSRRVLICGCCVCFAWNDNGMGWLTFGRDINRRPKKTSCFLIRLFELLNNILDSALSRDAIDCHTSWTRSCGRSPHLRRGNSVERDLNAGV